MSILRRAVVSTRERRSAFSTSDPWTIPPPGGALGQMSAAGTVVNEEAALSLMTFFAGVRILADSVSLTPLRAVTQTPEGTRVPVEKRPEVITSPFMGITLEEGLTQIVTSLILRGNAYLYQVEWDSEGPTCWRILHPDQVAVSWDDHGYRKYKIGGVDADAQNIDHISNFMLPNSLKGAGIIEYCRNSLGLGVALDDVAGEFFRNGIMSTGVIGVDAPLSPDEARAVADQFGQRHAGVRRAHLPIVMGGGAKYTPISLTPEDAQFIQSRQFQSGEIATLLGIPPHLLGIVDRTTSWGTGIEVQGRAFVDYTLRAYYKRIESFFTRYLRPGTYAEFVTDALTRADTATRYAGYHNALMDGWLNTDEVRLREGLPPLPNEAGQVYRTPASQIPASNGDGMIATAPAAGLPSDNPNTGD